MIVKEAFAQTLQNPLGDQFGTIASIVDAFVVPVMSLAGIVLFALLVYGGFKYLTAGEDVKAVEAARSIMRNAVIGFVIIFGAYWLTAIIAAVFGLEFFAFG